jgi:hypothetical protein
MYRFVNFLLFLFLCTSSVFAQKETFNWLFGNRAWVNFDYSPPQTFTGSQIGVNLARMACASYSDKSGKLILYSDGQKIWNGNHQIIKGGADIDSASPPAYHIVLLPDPGNPKRYYMISSYYLFQGTGEQGAYYTLISFQNDPNGEVLVRKQLIKDNSTHGFAVASTCQGDGYWLIFRMTSQQLFHVYKLSSTGISVNPITSFAFYLHDRSYQYHKVSPDGSKLAIGTTENNLALIHLYDFNNQTGEITNPRVIKPEYNAPGYYGLSFSPNSRLLYALLNQTNGQGLLHQYDITYGTTDSIANSLCMVDTLALGGALQLAPDGKIYIEQINSRGMSAIEKPDVYGRDCSVNHAALQINGASRGILPYFVDNNFTHNNDTAFICVQDSVRIGNPGYPGYTYKWSPAEGLNNPNIPNPIASPLRNTLYTAIVTNKNGCQSTYSQYVKLINQITVLADSTMPICKGDTLRLRVRGGSRYAWYPAAGLSDPTIPNPIAQPDTTTIYKVVVSKGACIDSAFIRVVVIPKPIANAGADQISCSGNIVSIGSDPIPGITYEWTPSIGLNAPNRSRTNVLPQRRTEYILKAVNSLGCISYDTVIVNTGTQPVLSLNKKDTALCSGQSLSLIANGATRYKWFPNDGLDSDTLASVIARPNSTTTYTVYGYNGDCTDSARITITIVPQPIAAAGTDKQTCIGRNIILGSPLMPGMKYAWSPARFLNDSTVPMPICTPQADQEYILTVTNSLGCISKDTVKVSIGGSLSLDLTADTAICPGGTVQLNVSGADEYRWQPAAGLSQTTIANPIASPMQTTTYYVTGLSGACQGIDSITITVLQNPVIAISGNTVLCTGESTQLKCSGAVRYQWSPANGLSNTDSASPVASPDKTTTYYVTGFSAAGCSSTDSITIQVLPPPVLRTNGNQQICQGGNISLQVSGATTYQWFPAEGLDNTSSASPIASPKQSTMYYVTGKNGNCTASDSIFVLVQPSPVLSVQGDTLICAGQSAKLRVSGADTYSWTTKGQNIDNPDRDEIIVSPVLNTMYYVSGQRNGCTAMDSIFVRISTPQIINPAMSVSGTYLPGQTASVQINIPKEFTSADIEVFSDSCCAEFRQASMNSIPLQTLSSSRSRLKFRLPANNGAIELPVTVYLPPDGRKGQVIQLSIPSFQSADPCIAAGIASTEIQYNTACAWSIRGISGQGKQYSVQLKEDGSAIEVQPALDGSIYLGLYTLTGKCIWQHSAYMHAGTNHSFPLPQLIHGIYSLQSRSGPLIETQLLLIQ